ncbi:SdpI family protein [Silvanigrella aquatica]
MGIFHSIKHSEPNKFFGFRTKKSLESKKNWKILNLYACYYMSITQNIFLILNLITIILKIFYHDNHNFIEFIHVFLVVYLLLSILFVFIKVRIVEKRIKL